MEIQKISSYIEPLGSGIYDEEMIDQVTATMLFSAEGIYVRARISLGIMAANYCGTIISDPGELYDMQKANKDWLAEEAEMFRAVGEQGSGLDHRQYMLWHQDNDLPLHYYWESYVCREFSMDGIRWTPAEYALSPIASETNFLFENDAIRDAEQFLDQKILQDPFYWKKLIAHDLSNWDSIASAAMKLSDTRETKGTNNAD